VSAITDALDRMDFWSLELMFDMQQDIWSTDALFGNLFVQARRVRKALIVAQFQAAQEASRSMLPLSEELTYTQADHEAQEGAREAQL
jgi:hypothetical protein